MQIFSLFLGIVGVLVILLCFSRPKDVEIPTNAENDNPSLNIHNTKRYSEPEEVATPVKETETFVKVVAPGLSLYNVRRVYDDLLPLNGRAFHSYKVKGKNLSTGRIKTYSIEAYDTYYATQKAISKGLGEPFEITVCDEPPTEKQKQFIIDLGMKVKPEFTKEDASCIISRTYEQQSAPEQWLMDFALGKDIPFSLYATSYNVLYHIQKEYFVDIIHEIAFWLYAVDRVINGVNYFNENKYIDISEMLCVNAEFMRLYNRARKESNINYLKLNKRIKAYQFAKEALA